MRIFLLFIFISSASATFSQQISKSRTEILKYNFSQQRNLLINGTTGLIFQQNSDRYYYYFNANDICYEQLIEKDKDSLGSVISHFTNKYSSISPNKWIDQNDEYVYEIKHDPIDSFKFVIDISRFNAKDLIESNLFKLPVTKGGAISHIKQINGILDKNANPSDSETYFFVAGTYVKYSFIDDNYCYQEAILLGYQWKQALLNYFNTSSYGYDTTLKTYYDNTFMYEVEDKRVDDGKAVGCLLVISLRLDDAKLNH